MDEKDNVAFIKEHPGFLQHVQESREASLAAPKATNPIAKNFIKYLGLSDKKFSIKDILR